MGHDLRGGPGYRALRAVVRGLLRLGWGLRVSGLSRLPAPPYLLTPNHGSEIDAVVLAASLPFKPTVLAAHDLERFPVLFRLIRWFDPVFVKRGGLADVGSVRTCIARLLGGDVLAIFPEGRVIQEAALGPFHPGAAFVALRVGAPLVPGAKVVAEVVRHFRGPKIIGLKYKKRKDYRRHWGARRDMTELKIRSIQV